MKKLAFILCMGLFPMFSFACSPGVGGGPSGDPHCMAPILANDPYYNGSMNQQQTPVVVHIPSKYGAVAMNMDTGYASGVLNQDSLSKAKKAALTQCRQGNPKASCRVASWVRNGCIAAARGQIINNPTQWTSFFCRKRKGIGRSCCIGKM